VNDKPPHAPIDYSPDRPHWSQRAAARRWLLAVLLLVLLVPAVWVGAALFRVHRMKRNLADLDARYRRVERGMTVAEVQAVMGSGGRPQPGPWFAAWDDDPLDPGEATRITSALRYYAPTPFVGVDFEVQFDKDGRVVGKNRYD
jgi:hypothetical protein